MAALEDSAEDESGGRVALVGRLGDVALDTVGECGVVLEDGALLLDAVDVASVGGALELLGTGVVNGFVVVFTVVGVGRTKM